MMNKYLSYIFVAVLTVVLFYTCTRESEPRVEIKETHTVDSVYVYKTDTIVRYEPQYITQTVIRYDTLVLTKDSIIYLPVSQKHYSEPDLYDVWVSGYDAKMDSIKTYHKTEYLTVEKVIEREITKNKYEFYVSGGLNVVCGDLMPEVGVCLTTSGKTLYKANVGLYNGEVTYGIGVGFKLF